ncbi:hypothetical protein FC84_GL001680 [Lapidilactobacillus dextrinicus DSM 20335]|uniref:Uncharacterized protein n=1 Tax=Lapidilactobacillus dextrinicus DSM 20335 TaxID=1423738 RepID=A0A0R2BTD9_9LACO|nr:hypothetical protein [Lapidilactobacillus dextrinicus]KRM79499.1 hypothetical protein FC84_GL001680 [Lapidilactobacillus dextrinicus DSM 20335]QFG46668.1 hypothetical protein LH506_04055 [Lapidilactobacillus dextrinicus]
MKFTGAVINEQGIDFSIIQVKPGYLTQQNLQSIQNQAPINFPRPVILAEQTTDGYKYLGRPDIVNFLSGIYVEQIPWQNYSV